MVRGFAPAFIHLGWLGHLPQLLFVLDGWGFTPASFYSSRMVRGFAPAFICLGFFYIWFISTPSPQPAFICLGWLGLGLGLGLYLVYLHSLTWDWAAGTLAILGTDPSQDSILASTFFYFWHLLLGPRVWTLPWTFFTFDTFYHFVIQNNHYREY